MTGLSLDNRVALVTGASRGIGRAIARRLAAHGAKVAVTSSEQSAEGLRKTCELIRTDGGSACFFAADLGDAEARRSIVSTATADLGPVDILVNNAAANPAYAPPSKINLAARLRTFEINFQAPVDLAQQVLPGMKERGWGRILNISSDMASQPSIPYIGPDKFIHSMAIYGASKAALNRYTVGLAAELHGTGVTVNGLAPYKIAASESAAAVARDMNRTHPDWVESVEVMAEAAYLLIRGQMTGLVVKSRDILQMTQSPLHALDGRTVIGDATTVLRIS